MITKLTSIQRVISKVVRELGLGAEEIPVQDFIEVCSDALLHIGAFPQFEKKIANLEITDFAGQLPCDHYKTIRIINGECFNSISYNEYLISTEDKEVLPTKFTNFDFSINFDTITTAYRRGVIQIEYLAIPVDDCGLPLVPDDISYQEALFWRVARFLAIRDELKNKRLSVEYCESQWLKYCTQARASAVFPDSETMHRLANQYVRLKPNLGQYKQLFSTLGK